MLKRHVGVLLGTASLFAFGYAGPVEAQQAAQPTASAGSGLEEIVVTARRREERLQTVPLAITAFNAASLEQHSIQNLVDLQHNVPSYTYNATQRSGIGATPTIRGLPGVITYFAEVPELPANELQDTLTFDLDNLQVLKGPQGTLFGQNTTGGVILFQPKRPQNDFEGFVDATLGDYNWHKIQAVVNVPIIEDKLLIRIGGMRDERDGFTTVVANPLAGRFAGLDLDNRDSWYGRIGIIVRPTDDIENYLVADTAYVHTNGTTLVLDKINPDVAAPGNSLAFLANQPPFAVANPLAVLAAQKALGVRRILGFDPLITFGGKPLTFPFPGPIEKAQNFNIVDTLRWDVNDNIVVKNILGYVNSRLLTRSDFDGSPFITQGFVTTQGYNSASLGTGGGAGVATAYSEELQLQGRALNEKLQYQIGAFLRYQSSGPASEVVSTGSPSLGQILVNTGGGFTSRTQALYAQGTYDMSGLWDALQGLKFTGGYRYNWDWGSGYQHIILQELAIPGLGYIPGSFLIPVVGTNCAGGVTTATPNNCDHASSAHFHSPGWTLSLDYAIDPQTLVYVRSSKGYRAGGFTPQAPTVQDQTYQPEYLVDVEVGIKADYDVFGMPARSNVAAYHGWYSNIQTNIVTFVNILGSKSNFGVTENAASATAEGIEGEFSIQPVTGLELRANTSFNHNVYDNFSSAAFGQLKGLSFAGFPKLKVNLGATYHLPIDESWGDVALNVDWNYQTHSNLSTDNGPSVMPTHRLLNWRIDWNSIMGTTFDVGFFMTNATDTLFPVGSFGLYNQQGFVSYDWNEPRMWGFELRYRFGGPESPPETAPPPPPPPVVQAVKPAPKSYLVFFDFDKSGLTPEARTIVDQAAAGAEAGKVTRIELTGHTDTVGSDAYNLRLSERRAETVAAELEKKGIPAGEIAIFAKGKHSPLVPTADGVKEPQNRRVEIVYNEGGPTS